MIRVSTYGIYFVHYAELEEARTRKLRRDMDRHRTATVRRRLFEVQRRRVPYRAKRQETSHVAPASHTCMEGDRGREMWDYFGWRGSD